LSEWEHVSFYDYMHQVRDLIKTGQSSITGKVTVAIFEKRLHVVFGSGALKHSELLLAVAELANKWVAPRDCGGCLFVITENGARLFGSSGEIGLIPEGTKQTTLALLDVLVKKIHRELDKAAD
jgi:hypothetical protein